MSAPAGAAGPVTKTFFNTGGEQTYSVPPAATSVHVTVVGAPGGDGGTAGGGGAGGAGGFGALVDGEVPTSGVGILFVEVGTPGGLISSGGGFGGAGAGMGFPGPDGAAGGGGGGASDVRTCSIDSVTCNTLASRMLIAGGGGGGGGGWGTQPGGAGGNADGSGQPPGATAPTGGGSGSASAPCAANGGKNNGENGSLGLGGHGGSATTNYSGGGGGGGGLCGGGGGGAADSSRAGGGGGGSSFFQTNVVDLPTTVSNTKVPSVKVTYNDATAPSVTFQTPFNGVSYSQGRFFAVSYACADDQGGAGVATCDGPVPPGGALDTSTLGVHHFSVTTTDKVGNSATRTVDYNVAPSFAQISNVSETNRRWREGNALPAVTSAARKLPVGTTFSLNLDMPATVRFPFARSERGRVVGRRCVKPTKRNAKKRPCHRRVVRGRLTFPGRAGVNRVRFAGRLGRKKRLPPGSYRLVMNATTAQGQKSHSLPLRFTIVR